MLRPTAGLLEWVGKGTHGMGLVCLGREAITGSAQRRMRAPGALSDEPADVRSQGCLLHSRAAASSAGRRRSGAGSMGRKMQDKACPAACLSAACVHRSPVELPALHRCAA